MGDTTGNGDASGGNKPGGGIGAPIDTPDPLSKYKWWILGGLALLLVAAAGFLLRKPDGAPSATHTPAQKGDALTAALKDELFALESDRISGKITDKEYAENKAALETVIKRAIKKA